MTRDYSVNQRLRAIMRQKRIKQTELSGKTGIHYQNLHRAVNGKRPIYADELPVLAAALGIPVGELLGVSPEEQLRID